MPPKGKKAASSGQQKAIEEEREEPLQALILTDSFETRFAPFSLEKPRCLLPLANTPLIEYTFEFLANAGVEEVFVHCAGPHKELIEQYIQNSKWQSKSSPFSALEIIRSVARSVGDAMRDLDKRAILRNDFFIVYGDVVAGNLSLAPALAAHRKRRATDKNAIMTMVLREVAGESRMQGGAPVFVMDPSKDRCLHYETAASLRSEDNLTLDPELLEGAEIEVRADLLDCGIDVCTPDVLALWSDNFDFQTPRANFLYGVLKDYELNGKTIHAYVEEENFVARVQDLPSYDAVSQYIVSRWSFPMVPDSNLLGGQTYRLQKGNIYKEQGVVLARSCIIDPRSVIGQKSSIGDATVVSNSIIGRRCVIGRNVVIDGAYIWDDVVIGDGTIINRSIIANEAIIGKKCDIQPGALVSFGVKISDGTILQGTSRVTRMKRKRHDVDEEAQLEKADPDLHVVGPNGDGVEYFDSEEEEEEDDVENATNNSLVYNLANLSLSTDSISTLNSESSLSDIHHRTSNRDRSTASSFLSIGSDDSQSGSSGQKQRNAHEFHHEAVSSLFESLQHGDDPANMLLELNALRLSTNASEHQVRRAIVAAFVRTINHLVSPPPPPSSSSSSASALSIKAAIEKVLPPNSMLLSRTVFDKHDARKADQIDLLLLLQQHLVSRPEGDAVLLHFANELCRLDVVEADGFEQWWADGRSEESDEMRKVRAKTKQLIDFLLEEEEEDDDDEDDEDDEDEDDD